MAILRSGLVLFVLVTAVAMAIAWGLLSLIGAGRGSLDFTDYERPVLLVCAVTFTTSILLVVLAWRGRRHPLLDGVAIMIVMVLTIAFVMSASIGDGSQYPDNNRLFIWLGVSAYLACLVPAYLFSYLALCRTPLLRGLVPLPKRQRARRSEPLTISLTAAAIRDPAPTAPAPQGFP